MKMSHKSPPSLKLAAVLCLAMVGAAAAARPQRASPAPFSPGRLES
jgi:hypothetical protein